MLRRKGAIKIRRQRVSMKKTEKIMLYQEEQEKVREAGSSKKRDNYRYQETSVNNRVRELPYI